jgi:hypothetical protein
MRLCNANGFGAYLFHVVVACAFMQPTMAGTINYIVSGNYASSTPATSLTAPNAAFFFQFAVPLPVAPTATVGSIEFTLSDPITYLLNGSMTTCNMAGEFFAHFSATTDALGLTCANGSTVIDVDLGGTPILSTGSVTNPGLVLGTFVVPPSSDTQVQVVTGTSNQFFPITSAAIISNVPEPSTVPLVLTGVFAVFSLRRRT